MSEGLYEGANIALQSGNILMSILGVTVGMLVGVLPGLGPLAAMSVLLPMSYGMDLASALMLMGGIWYGSAYGGAITAILLNIPGTAFSAVTTIDGYPLAQQGRAGQALFLAALASLFGGIIGIVATIILVPILAQNAAFLSPPENVALILACLIVGSGVGGTTLRKGLIMSATGILLGLVGTDIISGKTRFTFGILELSDGIALAPLAIGIFGLSEIILSVSQNKKYLPPKMHISLVGLLPSYKELRRFPSPALRGSVVGSIFGILPGIGPTIASYLAYALERRVSITPECFGKGQIEGLIAPESANNASDQTAFIPTLALGIPGSASMAIMLSVLTIHGVTPGPFFVVHNPEIFWALIFSFLIGNMVLFILNVPLIGLWVMILRIPKHILFPFSILIMAISIYAADNSEFNIFIMGIFGLIGAMLRIHNYPMPPLLLGFILGPLLEQHARRAILISQGDYRYALDNPMILLIIFSTYCLIRLLGKRV